MNITESERQSILRLHEKYKNSLLSEQSSDMGDDSPEYLASTNTQNNSQTIPSPTTDKTTSERWKTSTCSGLKKTSRCVDKVLQVQIKINDKCPTDKLGGKLVEDGIWGQKTDAAYNVCGGRRSEPQTGTPSSDTPPSVKPEQGGQPTGDTTPTPSVEPEQGGGEIDSRFA